MAEYSWANRAREKVREKERKTEKFLKEMQMLWCHQASLTYFSLYLSFPFKCSTFSRFLLPQSGFLRVVGGLVGGETERLPWKQSTSPIWASLMALWRGNNCVPLASLWESVCMCGLWHEEQQRMCRVIQYSMNKGFQESQTVWESAQTHGAALL